MIRLATEQDLPLVGSIYEEILAVANGKQTKAESLGFTEMAIARVCNYV